MIWRPYLSSKKQSWLLKINALCKLIGEDGITSAVWVLHRLAVCVRERAALFIWCWTAQMRGLTNDQCFKKVYFFWAEAYIFTENLGWFYIMCVSGYEILVSHHTLIFALVILVWVSAEGGWTIGLNCLRWNNLCGSFFPPKLGCFSVKTERPDWDPANEGMMVSKSRHSVLSLCCSWWWENSTSAVPYQ